MIDLLSVGYLGRVFLVCRGIAGGLLRQESPVVVDRLATLIHNGEAACPECLGLGFLGDLGRCDGCRGTGVDPEVVASLAGEPTEVAA